MMKEKGKRAAYTLEYKLGVIRLSMWAGLCGGAKMLDTPRQALGNWVKVGRKLFPPSAMHDIQRYRLGDLDAVHCGGKDSTRIARTFTCRVKPRRIQALEILLAFDAHR